MKEIEKKTEVEDKVVQEKNDVDEKNKVEGKKLDVAEIEDEHKEAALPINECPEWELTIGSPTNIVAYATIDVESNVIHGKPLAKENARVSITRVVQGTAQIPFPINDEIMTVEQALGTYIAWPRNITHEVKTSSAPVKETLKVNFL